MTIDNCTELELLDCRKLAEAIDDIAQGRPHEISDLDQEMNEVEADVAEAKRLLVKVKSGTMTRDEAIKLTGLTEEELAECAADGEEL